MKIKSIGNLIVGIAIVITIFLTAITSYSTIFRTPVMNRGVVESVTVETERILQVKLKNDDNKYIIFNERFNTSGIEVDKEIMMIVRRNNIFDSSEYFIVDSIQVPVRSEDGGK